MAEDYSVRSSQPHQPFQSMDKVKIVNRAQHETIMKLIEAVRKFPVLYNSKRTDYRDVDLKRHYWHQVQAETQIATVEECQKLWKTLRDRFIRETRVLENNEKLAGFLSESAAAAAVRWPYYEALMFYRNCGRSPRTYLSSSTSSNNAVPSRRASLPPATVLNSSGEDNNTSSSLNSTQSNEEHQFPSHQAFIEAVFRQAKTRLETPSPSSSQESIPLAFARDPSSPNSSQHYGPSSPQVAVAVVRPISPGALVNATSSMALVSRESSVQSIHEECNKSVLNDSRGSDKLSTRPVERGEGEAQPTTRERISDDLHEGGCSVSKTVKCNDIGIDGQVLNLSVHNLNRSARESTDEEPEPKKQKTSDEDELFALSLIPSLKRLGAKVKSLTKIKILQQLVMAEFGVDEVRQE